MPSKQSLMYSIRDGKLCNNSKFEYPCNECIYTIRDVKLLIKLTFRDITLIIESILICEMNENIGIDPRTIAVSCRGNIKYETMPIKSSIKLSTNAELFKCILDMWMSIYPVSDDVTIPRAVAAYRKTIDICTSYDGLCCVIKFISQNFTSWFTASL